MIRIGRVEKLRDDRTMLLRAVEKFLREHGIPATRFGRESVRDPRLVLDLRKGREPGERITRRIEHFMNTYRRSAGL